METTNSKVYRNKWELPRALQMASLIAVGSTNTDLPETLPSAWSQLQGCCPTSHSPLSEQKAGGFEKQTRSFQLQLDQEVDHHYGVSFQSWDREESHKHKQLLRITSS